MQHWPNRIGTTLLGLALAALLDCQASGRESSLPDPVATPDAGDARNIDDAPIVFADSAADVSPSETAAPRDAPSDVASSPDAGADAAMVDAGGDNPGGPVLYPTNQVQSPITASVAAVLQSIAARVPTRNTRNFMKVGDPIMGDALGSPNQVIQGDFFGCVESSAPIKDLASYGSLQATIDYFHQGNVVGKTPFARVSQCTRENLTSWDLLNQNLLPQEITDTNPSLAFVMFGSVDIGNGGTYTPSPQVDSV